MLEPNPLVNISDLENVEWYYGQSVQKIRQLVVNWKTLLLLLQQSSSKKPFWRIW